MKLAKLQKNRNGEASYTHLEFYEYKMFLLVQPLKANVSSLIYNVKYVNK